MDRQQKKDILEVVGFIALIASLVFVGIETRNSSQQTALNTQAIEMAAYQELMNNIQEFNELSLESSHAAEAMIGLWGVHPDDMEGFQQDRALFILFRHGDLAYFQYERGAIDEERLMTAIRVIPLWRPEVVDWWARRRHSFVPSYVEYVDEVTARYQTGEL